MPHPLEQLRDNALREIGDAPDEKTLEAVRVRYLGRNGSISAWGEKMKTLSQEERPVVGKLLNEPRNAVPDEIDATHSVQFHQIEGLYVDENVSIADLKGALEFFFRELLGPDTAVRFRPHYFPFTEPSFETDVQSKALKGGQQWIEVAGSGM